LGGLLLGVLLALQAGPSLGHIRGLIAEGKMRDAEKLLSEMDSKSPAVAHLRGVVFTTSANTTRRSAC
jgi:hypothetical protein